MRSLLLVFALTLSVMTSSTLYLAASASAPLQITHLRCEYKDAPRAIDAVHPRLSWQLRSETRGEKQTAYEILVARSPAALAVGHADLWDSGKIASSETAGIAYGGKSLESGRQCFWKVRVWDKNGLPAPDSPVSFWQMGLLTPSDWKAIWISAQTPRDTRIDGNTLPPCPYVRRTFTLTKPIKQATIFATARGLYELHLNGVKVGDALLTPGWTDYRKRIAYQAYDVSRALHPGANTVGAVLGDGWYCGYVGFARQRNLYGTRPALQLQLDIEYADGTHQTVGTDSAWQGRTGPIVYSDFLQGECYDARAALPGWDTPRGTSSGWQAVSTAADTGPPSRKVSVTAILAGQVRDNALSVVASNKLAGDPAYNTRKKLRVDYTLGGIAHTQTVGEDQTLTIPGPGDALGTLVLRRAVYGDLTAPTGPPALVGTVGPPVRVTEHLPARAMTQPAPGTYLFDIG